MTVAKLVETHLSHLLLLDDRVLKWKKAVAYDFIDLRTIEARRRNCEREVALNRRLAPDVYEGVAELVGPSGDLWEPVVVMRRLPDDRRLSALVETDDPAVPTILADLARLVADFHRRADRSRAISDAGRPSRVAARWEQVLGDLRGAGIDLGPAAADLAAVEALSTTWLAGRTALLEARADGGSIVDGHGDLQSDDVFALDDGPAVIDCLEFDDDLRAVDVADDVAFLAMDLEKLGRRDLAERFVAAYQDAADEPLPRHLLDHWIAYRATVRAMVMTLRASQQPPEEREALRSEAASFLRIARSHLDDAEVRLVVIGGGPGTGKSKLARGIAATTGWTVLRSDVVRQELFHGVDDRYAPDATTSTYHALLERAEPLLGAGESVVLDATWRSAAERRGARELAERTAARLIALRCSVDPAIAAARVTPRLADGTDASEATPEIATRLAGEFDPWDDAWVIDTSGPASASLETALDVVTHPAAQPGDDTGAG